MKYTSKPSGICRWARRSRHGPRPLQAIFLGEGSISSLHNLLHVFLKLKTRIAFFVCKWPKNLSLKANNAQMFNVLGGCNVSRMLFPVLPITIIISSLWVIASPNQSLYSVFGFHLKRAAHKIPFML